MSGFKPIRIANLRATHAQIMEAPDSLVPAELKLALHKARYESPGFGITGEYTHLLNRIRRNFGALTEERRNSMCVRILHELADLDGEMARTLPWDSNADALNDRVVYLQGILRLLDMAV